MWSASRALLGAILTPLLVALASALPVRDAVAQAPAAVAEWSRFEASFVPAAPPANPFDPGEIDVRAEFVSPGGKTLEVPAFLYQGYERSLVNGSAHLTPVGEPHFLVRFTPDRPGRWRWRWVVREGDAIAVLPYVALQVSPAHGRGFLRVSRGRSR